MVRNLGKDRLPAFVDNFFRSRQSGFRQYSSGCLASTTRQPLTTALGKKPEIKQMIDDGYWQGAPVGGFGAGNRFRAVYRGDFVRWHLKAGIHKYQSVLQINSVFLLSRREQRRAWRKFFCAGKPQGDSLASWNWNYPVGAGEYAALYPKSWFDYRAPELPVHLVLEQFSPILPGNYKETSYPVAVYNWYATKRYKQIQTVSNHVFLDKHGWLVP